MGQTDTICCDMGICAYNEAKNIGRLLNSIWAQKLPSVQINRVYVVASGCTDDTEEVVKQAQHAHDLLDLIAHEERRGKYTAINTLLDIAKADILVLCSADLILDPDAIQNLVNSLANPRVGMAGARPIPTEKKDFFLGFAINLLWDLHHQVSMQHPKMGELVAFRKKLITQIPPTAVDEAVIEAMIAEQGYEIVYAADSYVYNQGAKSIQDFIIQRRRIACGHLWLKKKFGYAVSTSSLPAIIRLVVNEIWHNKQKTLWILGTIFLEAWSRLLGIYDYYITKNHHIIWQTIDK